MVRTTSIDVNKTYRTRDGRRVICLQRVNYNSAGDKVTYPIKGVIVKKEKPLKTRYCIWSDDGRWDVVWGMNAHADLIEDTTTQEPVQDTQ